MFHEQCDFAETACLILDGLPMGILFCDEKGIIRFVNKAYASLSGCLPSEMLGKYILDVIPHSRAMLVMESAMAEMGELCQLGGEKSRPVIVNRLPVKNSQGQIAGMISQAIFRDPEDLQKLSSKIEQLSRKVSQYKKRFEASLAAQHSFASILGESRAIARLKRLGESYAALDEPVLILGPTGVGKELFAHALHSASPRANGPLVCINCATIPGDLFESELFGYVRGAFSGARQDGKMGQIELADKGTLFLDEIGEMPPDIQAKLLRVLETRTIFRLGSVSAKKVDFRLLAATNRNLNAMLRNGGFREDLFYRINTFVLEIPPLSEREDDILPIANYILKRMGLGHVTLAPETQEAMKKFHWPGNVRQLHNAVVHAATMRQEDILRIRDFPPEILENLSAEQPQTHFQVNSGQLADLKAELEANTIKNALIVHKGNVAATARNLKISRASLYEKMRKYGVNPRKLDL